MVFTGFIVVLATLGLMKTNFFLCRADNGGVPFALATIDFDSQHQFYSEISSLIGALFYLRTDAERRRQASTGWVGASS